jgi:hypothetical protein
LVWWVEEPTNIAAIEKPHCSGVYHVAGTLAKLQVSGLTSCDLQPGCRVESGSVDEPILN